MCIRDRRRPGLTRALIAGATVVVTLAGVAATRSSYRELRGSKRLHAEIAHRVAELNAPYVVTDLWWLDQLAAAASPRPTFLYVRDRAALERLVAIMRGRGIRRFASVDGAESAAAVWAGGWEGEYRLAGERHGTIRDLRFRTYVLP